VGSGFGFPLLLAECLLAGAAKLLLPCDFCLAMCCFACCWLFTSRATVVRLLGFVYSSPLLFLAFLAG